MYPYFQCNGIWIVNYMNDIILPSIDCFDQMQKGNVVYNKGQCQNDTCRYFLQHNILRLGVCVCLLDLILYVPSTIFQL